MTIAIGILVAFIGIAFFSTNAAPRQPRGCSYDDRSKGFYTEQRIEEEKERREYLEAHGLLRPQAD
jgi:hypothetical protein